MQPFAPYGNLIKPGHGLHKNGTQGFWEGGRVKADVMNDLLYRSNVIDNIVTEDGTWKPQTFRSSREHKYARQEENVGKFMDDDDIKTWEAQRVLIPVIRQRTSESIASQFLQFVKWQQKKSGSAHESKDDSLSTRLFLLFQNVTRQVGSTIGLSSTKSEQKQVTKRRVPEERRKMKKQRISMKLSINDDYEVEDFHKGTLPTVDTPDNSKPKFIPRSSRLLTQKSLNNPNGCTGKTEFIPATKNIKYDLYTWPPKHDGSRTEKAQSVIKSEPDPELVPDDLNGFQITVQAFRKLNIVPPLASDIAASALQADHFPFSNDHDKQQRYIYFLQVQAERIPNSSLFTIPKSITFATWKHELNEFTQLAMRYRPMSDELAQRFAPASSHPIEPATRDPEKRTVEAFVPLPLLLTRFGLPQLKEDAASVPPHSSGTSIAEPFNQPLQSNVVNLYENLAITGKKAPRAVFEKIFKFAA